MPSHLDIRYLLEIRPRAPGWEPQVHPLPDQAGPIRIGRDPACDVVIEEPTVSALHCAIQRLDACFHIKDLASRNGTEVCGIPIPQDRWVPLLAGSHIEVGDVFLFPADHRRRLALTAFSASEWMGRAGKVYGIDAAASF
ncbi:FHA domain-containing protein, partial [Haliangium sp.]